MAISKNTTIGQLLQRVSGCSTDPDGDRNALPRMPFCADGDRLREAAMVHGIDADLLVEKINAQIAAGKLERIWSEVSPRSVQ